MNKDNELATAASGNMSPWGDRDEVIALGRRLQATLPGGNKMSSQQAVALAQYAILTGTNPLRGDIYGFSGSDGGFVLVEGYKLLVANAKKDMPYTEEYFELGEEEKDKEGLAKDDIAYRCVILRKDQMGLFSTILTAAIKDGMAYREAKMEAYRVAGTESIGVVRHDETWSKKYNKPIEPPKGMTQHEKAKIRALKNGLRRSHGFPSLQEIAQQSYMVGETQTIPADWDGAEKYNTQAAREKHAQLTAWDRERRQRGAALSDEERQARFEKNVNLMRGPEDDDIIDIDDDSVADISVTQSQQPPPSSGGPIPGPRGVPVSPAVSQEEELQNPGEYEKFPDSPKALLSYLVGKAESPYENVHHLYNAIKKNIEVPDWSWPAKNDEGGWRLAAHAAIGCAKGKARKMDS